MTVQVRVVQAAHDEATSIAQPSFRSQIAQQHDDGTNLEVELVRGEAGQLDGVEVLGGPNLWVQLLCSNRVDTGVHTRVACQRVEQLVVDVPHRNIYRMDRVAQ